MKLRDIFSPDAISLNMLATDKSEALHELVALLKTAYRDIDENKTIGVLLDRERLGSTAIGEGVAIPHGKLEGLSHVIGGIARSAQGIDFEAYDEAATHFFFILLAPEGQQGVSDHLKALAKISRLLRNPQFREQLNRIEDKEEMYNLLIHSDA